MVIGTPDFACYTTVKTDKSLPFVIKASGVGILGACCAMQAKLPVGASVLHTEIKRVQFLHGGFRVLSNVSRRTLRKYVNDASTYISNLKVVVN